MEQLLMLTELIDTFSIVTDIDIKKKYQHNLNNVEHFEYIRKQINAAFERQTENEQLRKYQNNIEGNEISTLQNFTRSAIFKCDVTEIGKASSWTPLWFRWITKTIYCPNGCIISNVAVDTNDWSSYSIRGGEVGYHYVTVFYKESRFIDTGYATLKVKYSYKKGRELFNARKRHQIKQQQRNKERQNEKDKINDLIKRYYIAIKELDDVERERAVSELNVIQRKWEKHLKVKSIKLHERLTDIEKQMLMTGKAMQIFIRSITGKTHTLVVSKLGNDKISDIKLKVQDKEDLQLTNV